MSFKLFYLQKVSVLDWSSVTPTIPLVTVTIRLTSFVNRWPHQIEHWQNQGQIFFLEERVPFDCLPPNAAEININTTTTMIVENNFMINEYEYHQITKIQQDSFFLKISKNKADQTLRRIKQDRERMNNARHCGVTTKQPLPTCR